MGKSRNDRRNAIAKDLRTPKYRMRVQKKEPRERIPTPGTQHWYRYWLEEFGDE